MLYTKLSTIEIVKSALEYFGKSEVFGELTEDEWLMVPYYLSATSEGEVFITDVIDTSSDLEVEYKLLKESVNILKYNSRFMGYFGMPIDYYKYVGKQVNLYYSYNGETHTNIGVLPDGSGFTDDFQNSVSRGNIVTFHNPFGDVSLLKEVFGIEADSFVVTNPTSNVYAVCQVRGTKIIKEIPKVFLKHIGNVVRFTPTPIKFDGVIIDSKEVTDKVFAWYDDCGRHISSEFKNLMIRWTSKKLEYQNFLFRDGINYHMNKDQMFHQKCIKLHPKYKEMIEVLKELGIDTEVQKENIFNNVLIVEGARKPKTVTGFIQTHKKIRYDNVYSEAKELFKEDIWVSIDPYEFVTASHNTNSNSRDLSSSCFRLDGQYHAAVWAYVQSRQTFIIKVKASNNTTSFRMWGAIDTDSGGLLFGRHYGNLSDYQYKVIRYVIEEKFANFLGLPNAWVSGSKDIELDYEDSNTYWDTPHKVVLSRAIGASSFSLTLGEGLNCECECSDEGYFNSGQYCDCCETYGHNETTYVEGYDNICNSCLSDDFSYSDVRDRWFHNSSTIYIEDLRTYDHEDNADSYREYAGDYYSELPDNVVYAQDSEEYRDIDDCWYCQESCEYYYSTSYRLELVNGDYIHEGINEGYLLCPDCDKWYPKSEENCPNCNEEVA